MSTPALPAYLGPAPEHWDVVPFKAAFDDETSGNPSVKQSDYLPEGALAVVDQGQDPVGGYTDDPGLACSADLPCIVFGDHTRAFKYVDHPFAIGAQGTRVLVPKGGLDPRFAYHYLRQLRLADGGYSRHYKYLKREAVPVPPPDEQRRITDALDRAEAVRATQRRALARLDDFLAAVFDEMCGGSNLSPATLGDLALDMRNGLSPSRGGDYPGQVLTLSAVTRGAYDASASKEALFDKPPPEDRTVDQRDFLVCRGNGNLGLVGQGVFPNETDPTTLFPDTVIGARIDQTRVVPEYLEAAWRTVSVRAQIERLARTTNGIYKINQQTLSSVEVELPSLDRQERFAEVVRQAAPLRERLTASGARLDALYASLAARAFRGALPPPRPLD